MKPIWSSDSIALEAQIQTEDKLSKSVYKFNVSPEEGVVSLLKFLNLDATPANVAHALITVPDLVGERIGEYLSRPENNHALVEYFIQVAFSLVDQKAYEREFSAFEGLSSLSKMIIISNDENDYSTASVKHIRLRDFLVMEDFGF